MIYLLKPKYNQVYECENEAEKDNVINEEGGVFIIFDHYPDANERFEAHMKRYFHAMLNLFKKPLSYEQQWKTTYFRNSDII